MAGNTITALLKLIGDSSSAVAAINDVDQNLSGLQKTTKQVQGFGDKLSKTLTPAMVGLGALTTKMASGFETSLAKLEIAAGDAGGGLDQLHDAAIQVGGDAELLGVSASGAAESMTGLYKAGLSTGEIFGDLQGYMAGTAELGGALRASIDLAAASELDMVGASDLAATALATFGGELETTEERAAFINDAMNNLVQSADASVASVSGLADGLKNVGPVAASMGMSLQDTNNALAILSTRGIEGAEAGTALKSMLTNLRRPTEQVQDALKALDVSLYDAEGAFVGMPTVIQQLEDAFANLTQEQRDQYAQTIAGTYGINALNTLVSEGVDGWYDMADATAEAATIQEVAANIADTLSGKTEALLGSLETLGIQLGEVLVPYLTDFVDNLIEVVEWMTALPEPTKRVAVALGAILAVAGPVLSIVARIVSTISMLSSTIGGLVGSLGGMSSSALSGADALAAMGGGAKAAQGSLAGMAGALGLVGSALAGVYAGGKLATPISKLIYGEEGAYRSSGLLDTLTDVQSVLVKISTILAAFGLNIIQKVFGDWPAGQKIVGFVADIANTLDRIGEHKGTINDAFKLDPEVANVINQLSQGQMADYAEMAGAIEHVGTEVITLEEAQRRAAEKSKRVIGAWAARYEGLAEAAGEAAMSQEEIDRAVRMLNEAISGSVGKEQERYLQQIKDIRSEMADTSAEIDEVQAAMREEAATAGTSSEKYKGLQGQLGELRGEYVNLTIALGDASDAHREHIKTIIYEMTQARLAADGWTEAEYNLALSVAESMGLIDDVTFETGKNVNQVLSDWEAGVIGPEEALMRLAGVANDAMADASGAVEQGGKDVAESADGMGKDLTDKVVPDMEKFGGEVKGVFDQATDDATGASEDLKGGVEEDFNAAKDAAQTAFDSMRIEIDFLAWTIRDDVATAIGKLPGDITAYTGDMEAAGSDLMGGLKGGILSRAGEIASAAAQVVRDAIAAARIAAAIASPSRKTREIGIEFVRGLIAGIDDADIEAIRRVEKFVADISDAFTELLDMAHKMWALGSIRGTGGSPGFKSIEEMFDAAVVWLGEMAERIKPLADPTDPGDFDPADRVKEFVEDFNKAFGELVSFADDLSTLIDTQLPHVDDAFEAAEAALQNLGDWVVALGPVLEGIALGMDEVTDEAAEALGAAEEATKALDGFMSALLGLGKVIIDILDFGLGMPKADVGDYLTQQFEDVVRLIIRISFWLDHLYAELSDVLPIIIQNVTDASREFMDDTSDAANALDGALGALLDFAGTITDMLAVGLDFPKADVGDYLTEQFEHVFRLVVRLSFWLDNLYRELNEVLPLVINNLNEATQAALADIDEATGTLDSFLSAMLSFADTLNEVVSAGNIPELLEGYTTDTGAIIITWSSTFEAVIDFVRQLYAWTQALYLELSTFVSDGLDNLDEETQAAIDRVVSAVGSLNDMFSALSGLTDMLADVAFVAGTEYLEEEDWAGLAWAVTRTMQVVGTALRAAENAVRGIDAGAVVDAASTIGHVGEGLQALSEAFSEISSGIPPTEVAIEGFLASLVDFYEALKSYVHFFEEVLEAPFEGLSWYQYGVDLTQSLVDGIESKLPDLESTLQYIRDLMPSSPAKRGPLSEPVGWFEYLKTGLADALGSVQGMMATPSFDIGMPDMAGVPAVAGGSTKHYEFHAHYPQERPNDFRRQKRQMELVDRLDN